MHGVQTQGAMKQREKKEDNQAFERLIHAVGERLSAGKRVRRTLPFEGRLHIDRALPFLIVYRRPPKRPDMGTDLLLKGEASYIIASGSRKFRQKLTRLVHAVGEILADRCGAFIIIEIWSGDKESSPDLPSAVPSFRILLPSAGALTGSAETLKNALRAIQSNKTPSSVEIAFSLRISPPGLGSLISKAEADRLNCFLMGLEIQPVYRGSGNGPVYPLKLRKLHYGLSRALKRAAFEFSHTHTSVRPDHYYSLGRRAMVKAVWDVDRHLADINSAFDFLLLLTPVNIDSAWSKFRSSKCRRTPEFCYRPRNIDPAAVKRDLYKIRIERVEDPLLASLFREKRTELDRQITMIEDRNTERFMYGSLQLFGGVSNTLAEVAENILSALPPHSRTVGRNGYLDAAAIADRAKQEIDHYKMIYPSLSAGVQIRSDIVGVMVSRGNLLINGNVKIPHSRTEALLQHEIGTHILTYYNGLAQPFRQLYCGLAGYEELQEGIGVLAEYLSGGLSHSRLRLLAGRVIAVKCLTDGASFLETFRTLHRNYGFAQQAAFTVAARVYRGGGLTKDAVYLRGLLRLLDYLAQGGEIESLLVGKIATDHVPVIRELQWRKVLHRAPLRPRYLDFPEAASRLKQLRNGCSVINLIERTQK